MYIFINKALLPIAVVESSYLRVELGKYVNIKLTSVVSGKEEFEKYFKPLTQIRDDIFNVPVPVESNYYEIKQTDNITFEIGELPDLKRIKNEE